MNTTPHNMKLASFTTMDAAEAWRHGAGGWIFAEENGAAFIWFSLEFKPSQIITHQATRGMSGRLV